MNETTNTQATTGPELTAAEMRQASGGAIWLEFNGIKGATAGETAGLVVPVKIKHGV